MTVEIPLTNGGVAFVDDEDEDLVRQYRSWWVLESPSPHRSSFYARGSRPGDRRKPLMHKLLTGWPLVDHINGNGLDNRRENLRPATRSQNGGNRRKAMLATSRFKGVSRYPQDRTRWIANIGVEGQKLYLGIFADELNAALAYDMAARMHFGEYAALNFPEPGERAALAA